MSNFPLSLKNGPDQSLLSPIKPNGVYIYIKKKCYGSLLPFITYDGPNLASLSPIKPTSL
jgi:hypothetical protein